jgi:hypothetical protein
MPVLPFKTFQKLDLPLTEIVSGRIGFVHDLFLTFPYEVCEELPDGDQDLVVLTGKSGRGGKIEELSRHPGRVLLVVAPGDAAFRAAYVPERRGLPSNFVGAFAASNELADRRAVGVPLGVRVNKLRALQFVRQNHSGNRNGLLYGNFTVNDEHYQPDKARLPHIRARLVDLLQGRSWANLAISREQRDKPEHLIRYYSQIASHRFVLSPEGNGIDCYRTWEALYLGAIPIVMTSPTMTAFADLPILFTDDYSELSEKYLEMRWREMSGRSFEIQSLLKSYYLHRFLAAVATLNDPHFLCWKFGSEKFHKVLTRSSRSASQVVAETPMPPFTARRNLLDPEDWTISDKLQIEQIEGGLNLINESSEPAAADFPLQTIAGGPFRLTGKVSPLADKAATLTITAAERPGVLARVVIDGGGEREFGLDFVARSDRTVLSLATSASEKTSWQLRDLTVLANL